MNTTNYIALNADVGEGMENDETLIPYLNYANIACGGHAGNLKTIKETLLLCKKNKVLVGAHPSYPDKINFGRTSINITITDLEASLFEQINLVKKATESLGMLMHHIKLHGALYNDVFTSESKTHWFINWVNSHFNGVKLFIPVSAKEYVKEQFKSQVLFEAFVDRNYTDQSQLVSRTTPNASLASVEAIYEHTYSIAIKHQVTSVEGNKIPIKADTYCLHGDHPKVIAIAEKIHLIPAKI